MKKIVGFSLLTLLVSTAMITKKQEQAANKPLVQTIAPVDSGKIIYETYCLACHQEDGSGVPNMNPPLIKTDWVLGDSTKLIKVILNGLKDAEINGDTYSNEMPAHDFLTDKQVAEVLTYVRRSFGNKASAIDSEMVRQLRTKK
jgi:mono/diheme cytochrome c family protein